MKIFEWYKNVKNKNYNILFNFDNFNIYKSDEDIYNIKGVINIDKKILVKHLINKEELLECHPSILKIKDIDNNLRYIKIKLYSEYIDYPLIDRLEKWEIFEKNNKIFLYSKLINIPEKIKKKQRNDYVLYMESGVMLIIFETINNSTKIDSYIINLNINPIIKPALIKNLLKIYNEFLSM